MNPGDNGRGESVGVGVNIGVGGGGRLVLNTDALKEKSGKLYYLIDGDRLLVKVRRFADAAVTRTQSGGCKPS